MNRWRKMGKAYRLTDEYSTLWIRRIGRQFHLMYYRTTSKTERIMHGDEGGWVTLGVHDTLRAAQEDGSALMVDGEATAC